MRPKSFDEEHILQTIEETFRRVGYDGASLDSLTRATGLNRSSLYNAFGCKRDMMVRASETYTARTCMAIQDALSNKPFRNALRTFFTVVSAPESHGCLIGNLIAERAESDTEDRDFLACQLDELEAVITRAVANAQANGEIDASAEPSTLGRFIMSTTQGLRIMAQAREADPKLAGVINMAISAIPFTDGHGSQGAA